jgi:hypothetical protein
MHEAVGSTVADTERFVSGPRRCMTASGALAATDLRLAA